MFDALSQMGFVAKFSILVAVIPAFFGGAYAVRPNERRLSLMRPVSLAALFSALGGATAGLINMLRWASLKDAPLNSAPALMGLAESLVPLFVAFGSLTLAWLLVAVGIRRTP